jgi:shikimate dehydrogenase
MSPPEIYALIGQPIAGNPTQEMLEAAFAAGGINARYVSLDVPPEELAAAIAGVRALGLSGFHITAPHKAKVLPLLDELTTAAELIGAVNCIKREGDRLVGDNTDGRGFVTSLRSFVDLAGARVVVIGAGGAARAIAAELALAGAASILIVNRSLAVAEDIAATVGGRTETACAAALLTSGWVVPGDVDVVVQATIVGMGDALARLPLRWSRAHPSRAVAADVVIARRTGFLKDAAAAGYATIDGPGTASRSRSRVSKGSNRLRHRPCGCSLAATRSRFSSTTGPRIRRAGGELCSVC